MVGTAGVEGAVGRVAALAVEVEALADRARERAGTLVSARAPGWRGEAARRAAAVTADEAGRMHATARDLDDLAHSLRSHARTAGDRLEEVQRLLAGVTDLLGGAGPGGSR